MKNSVLLAIVSFALSALLTVSANAQATRTWISGVGDDANPCSRTAPCKTFAGAISKTATEGEIDCLDPGGFGALTITKSITVKCDPMSNGGVVVSGTNGFVISAAGAVVYLSGLDFEGLGSGLNGINILNAAKVYILNCTIRNFTQNGVNVSTSSAAHVVIRDSIIENSGTTGSSPLTGGVNIQSSSGVVGVNIINTVIDANANFAVQAGAGGAAGITRSYLTDSPVGLNLVGGGSAALIGPSNVITGTINGTPTNVAYK